MKFGNYSSWKALRNAVTLSNSIFKENWISIANKEDYRIKERRLWEFLVDGDFKF